MTISAKNNYIPLVSAPVFQAIVLIVLSLLWRKFLRRVYMMNIQNANIRNSALRTFAAEFFDKHNFLFPESRLISPLPVTFIPIILATFIGAVFSVGGLTADRTFSGMSPPSGMITSQGTILYPRLSSIGFAKRNIKFFMTILASETRSVFSHSSIITQSRLYFAIAEKRIHAATLQPQLFTEKQPEAEQKGLL